MCEELLSKIHMIGVEAIKASPSAMEMMCPSFFSSTAMNHLSGIGTNEKRPRPSHLATLFIQLHEPLREQGKQHDPNTKVQRNSFGGGGSAANPLSNTQRHQAISSLMMEAPDGVNENVAFAIFDAIDSEKGSTFSQKLCSFYSNTEGKLNADSKSLRTSVAGSVMCFEEVNTALPTLLSLMKECVKTATRTKNSYRNLGFETSNLKKCLQALLRGKYTDGNFKLSLLFPRTAEAAPDKTLESDCGVAQNGSVDDRLANSSTSNTLSPANNKRRYATVTRALHFWSVLAWVTCCKGWSKSLQSLATNMDCYFENGVPIDYVCANIALRQQLHTETVSKWFRKNGCETLSYTHDEEILLSNKTMDDLNVNNIRNHELMHRHATYLLNSNLKDSGPSDEKPRRDSNSDRDKSRRDKDSKPIKRERDADRTRKERDSDKPRRERENDRPRRERNLRSTPERSKRKPHSYDADEDDNSQTFQVKDMSRTLWLELYGTIKKGNDSFDTCFDYWTADRGCTKTSCTLDHDKFPRGYAKKPLKEQHHSFRQTVLRRCSA